MKGSWLSPAFLPTASAWWLYAILLAIVAIAVALLLGAYVNRSDSSPAR
jgi:membrane protein implicated in regulation of membrane protease activity